MNKKLHPKIDIDGLCAFRAKGGKDSFLCKTFIVNDEDSLVWYVRQHIELIIVAVWASITIHSENLTQLKEFKKEQERQQKENWHEKSIYGQYFPNLASNSDREKTWR